MGYGGSEAHRMGKHSKVLVPRRPTAFPTRKDPASAEFANVQSGPGWSGAKESAISIARRNRRENATDPLPFLANRLCSALSVQLFAGHPRGQPTAFLAFVDRAQFGDRALAADAARGQVAVDGVRPVAAAQ